jgi:hypothetical protein
MRRLIAVFSAVLIMCLLWLSPGCDNGIFGVVVGSGDMTTQTYDYSDFSHLQVENAFVVEVQRGLSYSVSVTVDDNLVDYLQISKSDNTLKLSVRAGYSYPNATFQAKVTMPNLEQLTLSGASRATVSGFNAQDDLKLLISGASSRGL